MKNLSNNHVVLRTYAKFNCRVSILAFLCLILLFKYDTKAQTCDYKVGTVSMNLTTQSTGGNFASKLVLTNSSGIIQYVSAINSYTIPSVGTGTYNAIAVTYNNDSSAPNLAVGSDINLVGSCNKTSPVSIGVCDCNNSTGVFAITQTGQTTQPGQINKFVLTNGKGVISAISSTPNFSNNGNGVYNVYGVSYTGTINNLAIGGLITSVSGQCVNTTQGLGYVVCVPELSIAKAGPSVADKGANYNYTFTISNSGTVASSGIITITDTLSTGLGFISGSGIGWACTSSTISSGQQVVACSSTTPIAAGGSSPINMTVVSTITGTVSNKAWINGGGNIKPNLPSNLVTTVINEPAKPNLAISKVGLSSGTVGVNFDYTLTISNTGTTGTSGAITVTDSLPVNVVYVNANKSGSGWTCNAVGQIVTCTSSTAIAVNAFSTILLTVTPITATVAGSSAKNTAYVKGGGDPSTTPKPSNKVSTDIYPTAKPNLKIDKNAPLQAAVGKEYNYTLTVSNIGDAITSGTITVTDTLASNLQYISGLGSGWTCGISGQLITCTTSTAISVNESSAITLVMKALDAASGTQVKNTAYVIGGGDPSTTPKPSNKVTTDISPAAKPYVNITKSGSGTGTLNTNYNYNLSVNNTGDIATSGVITATDNLPTGLTFISGGGSGWQCTATGQLVTCTTSAIIAVGRTLPLITLTVKPTQLGTYTNIATVTGGGDTSPKTSNTVTTNVTLPATPNLVLTKVGPPSAKVRANFDYLLTVNNTATIATSGVITVTDTINSNLQIITAISSGWTCTVAGQTLTCTSSNVILGGQNNLITVTVKPTTSTAIGSPVKNTGYVIGGGDVSTTPKPSNGVLTDISNAPKDDVTIAKGYPNTGSVGTNYNYTFNIRNGGIVATSGMITVTDNLQTGLTFISGSGQGFNCSAIGQSVTCTNNGTTQIPAGQALVITMVVKPTVDGVFKNTASVTTNGITKSSNEAITNVNCSTDIIPGTLDF